MRPPAGRPPAETEADAPDGRETPDPTPSGDVLDSATLSDGRTVIVRSVEPDDATTVAGGYRELSTTSAYQRFFTIYPELSAKQVRYFTAVDHRDHEAVGAVSADDGDGVGIARYIRDSSGDPCRAEMAIVVVDAWHRLGVGRQLMRVLCRRAREEGITVLRAEFLSENRALPALLRRFGQVNIESAGPNSTATVELTKGPDSCNESDW